MTLDFNNFPSLEFDRKLKNVIEYEKLESFVAKQTNKVDLNDWIDKFKDKLIKYFNEEYESWPTDIYQKRCTDLDYWVNEVKGKLSSLIRYITEKAEFFNKEDAACKKKYVQQTHCNINENCTIENQSTTFPQIDCNIYDDSHNPDNNSLLKNVLLSSSHTPLSSWLLTPHFKRKRNDLLGENTQNILEVNTEYSPQYTENVESSIGYHMISN
ncbi:PIR Superfamily Protein [Plasmodium ovale curtisi]|uniref:PIR Superfamily Protein n=1 Tax=Plasmodium ovale curtisi TaxID=864141 RepID=A0A1A8WH02_PLAOA|nr:PIR Superfamily Protein [Plasmodium ovale curtisi]